MEENFSHCGVEGCGEIYEKEGLRGLCGFAGLHEKGCCEGGEVGGLFGHASELGVVEELACVEDDLLTEKGVHSFGDVVPEENGAERGWVGEIGVVFVKPN